MQFVNFDTVSSPHVIIDHIIILLISFLNVYNMESIEEYFHRMFRIISGCGIPKGFATLLH